MSDYEYNTEEPEEDETLGDIASWIGVANSTSAKFLVETFNERSRETSAGGYSIGGTLKALVPVSLGLGLNGKKDSRQLELGERMRDKALNINPETYTKVRVNYDTNQQSKLVQVQLFKANDDSSEEKPFFTDRVKMKHGLIIIEDPSKVGGDNYLVIPAYGQRFEKNRWIPHSGVRMKGRKASYDPDFN